MALTPVNHSTPSIAAKSFVGDSKEEIISHRAIYRDLLLLLCSEACFEGTGPFLGHVPVVFSMYPQLDNLNHKPIVRDTRLSSFL